MSDQTRAPAAPESPDETVSDAKADVPVDRSRRWMRASKAVAATALGLLVTAWLIPAMSRQWDDRQKEHDLKAGIVSDMSTATAHALVGGERIWSTSRHAPLTPAQLDQVGNDWALAALSIDARLRSYFPNSSVVSSWELYSWAVDRFIKGNHVSMSVSLQDAVQHGDLNPEVANAAAQLLLENKYNSGGAAPSFGVVKSSDTHLTDARSLATLNGVLLAPYIKQDKPSISQYAYSWSALERSLLDLQQAVADQVVHAHASGFSTTPGDLVHDLLTP